MSFTRILADANRCGMTLSEIKSEEWATPLERVGLADSLTTSAEWLLQTVVEEARSEGVSWEKIGAMLGTTKQAAQQRFS
jgi:hypothetical protein